MDADLDKHPTAGPALLAGSVPVIDVARLSDPEGRAAAANDISIACTEWGFFQVINHGVPDALTHEVWRSTRWLFAQPAAAKQALLRSIENPWGYYHNELTKNQRDKKEVFDFTSEGADPIYSGNNRWPSGNARFRDAMLAYFDACTALSKRLLEAFCLGLKLPGNALEGQFKGQHTGFVRLNCYPVEDPLASVAPDSQLPVADMGVHHHSDAGALTILMQDEVGGLQVHKDGRWHDVAPLAGAFVINTGDMMQVWSNDRYKAAVHRVLAMKSRDRYSIPFFFNPRADAVVAPLRANGAASEPDHYRPISWAGYRGKRTSGDYADYGEEVQISQYRMTD